MKNQTLPTHELMNVNVTTPLTYLHLQKSPKAPLLLLFHGYTDSASSFFKRIHQALPENFEILAPNGIFPQPQRIENNWKEAYAWYFADLSAGQVLIHPEVSVQAILQLLSKLNLLNRKKILCGFSQGGYFLPFLANQLSNVEQIVTLGSGFRIDDYKKFNLTMPVHSFHGEDDEVISHDESKNQFEEVKKANPYSKFYSIPKMKHAINEDGSRALGLVLSKMNFSD